MRSWALGPLDGKSDLKWRSTRKIDHSENQDQNLSMQAPHRRFPSFRTVRKSISDQRGDQPCVYQRQSWGEGDWKKVVKRYKLPITRWTLGMNIMIYKTVVRINPRSSHPERIFFFFLLYLYKMMDVNWTYFSNPFTTYINQTILLYALNLYNDVC